MGLEVSANKIIDADTIFNSTTVCSQANSRIQGVMDIDGNKSQILDVTRHLTQLMIEKNTKELNKILDQNFTLTHITGYVQPKAEWFSEIESERMKYYSYKEVKTSVELDRDKAIFVGQNIIDARIWGSRNNWRLQQTMHLEKRGGKWIVIKSVATTF
jgi:hypothetical protein